MRSIFNKRDLAKPAGPSVCRCLRSRPRACCAAAAVRGGTSEPAQGNVYAFVPLPPGALVPGIEEPNLRAPEAVTAAIRSALDEVSPRTRSVTLVLPDTLVRVFVLDFDSLPAKAAEAIPVVRFRLRKMVPFRRGARRRQLSGAVAERNRVQSARRRRARPHPRRIRSRRARRRLRTRRCSLPSSLAALESVRIHGSHPGRQPQRARHHHHHRQRPGSASLSHPRPSRRLRAARSPKFSAASPWPLPTLKTSSASRPRAVHYAGIQDSRRICGFHRRSRTLRCRMGAAARGRRLDFASSNQFCRRRRRAGGSKLAECGSHSISPLAPSPISAPALKRLRIAMAVLAVLCILFRLGLHLFDRQAESARAREHSLDGQIAQVEAGALSAASGHDAPARECARAHAGRSSQPALR